MSFLTGIPFLTGSRAYGMPRPDSDTDLVIRITEWELAILAAAAGMENVRQYPENDSASIKFGSLNLICITSDEAYFRWRDKTKELVDRRPVTREQAIEEFASVGVTRAFDSAIDDDDDAIFDSDVPEDYPCLH